MKKIILISIISIISIVSIIAYILLNNEEKIEKEVVEKSQTEEELIQNKKIENEKKVNNYNRFSPKDDLEAARTKYKKEMLEYEQRKKDRLKERMEFVEKIKSKIEWYDKENGIARAITYVSPNKINWKFDRNREEETTEILDIKGVKALNPEGLWENAKRGYLKGVHFETSKGFEIILKDIEIVDKIGKRSVTISGELDNFRIYIVSLDGGNFASSYIGPVLNDEYYIKNGEGYLVKFGKSKVELEY